MAQIASHSWNCKPVTSLQPVYVTAICGLLPAVLVVAERSNVNYIFRSNSREIVTFHVWVLIWDLVWAGIVWDISRLISVSFGLAITACVPLSRNLKNLFHSFQSEAR
jgi:Na+-transporting NADH:ubiquinone oxidoreductase subunit NqrD